MKMTSTMEKTRAHVYSNQRTNSNPLIHITFLYLLIAIQCITAKPEGTAPLITPKDPDITVLPNDNVKFKCQSSEPIHWRFHEEFMSNYKVHDSYGQQSEHPYESVLELPNVDYTFVGYYYCVKNSSEADTNLTMLANRGHASKIYLFVEDAQHPFAPVSIPLIQGNQYEDVVIPCKPTSKKWEIQLIKESDERHTFRSTFSPTDGFRVKLEALTDGGLYTCHSKLDTVGEYDIHLNILMNLVGTKFVNKPIIMSKTNSYGIEGDQLELNCTVEAQLDANFNIKWTLPNNNISIEEGRARIIKPIAHNHRNNGFYYAVGQLIVNNLDKTKDTGVYKCQVEDDSGVHKSAALNVDNILGAQESFIDMVESAGKYSFKVTPKIKEVKWVVEYRGYPAPKLIWRDINGDEIPWSTAEQKSCKYEAIQTKQRVTLKIRNPRITDSGYYTLHADNGKMQKEQKFQLEVIHISKRPINSTTNFASAMCKNCKELIARLNTAEQQVKQLKLQLQEAKALNIRTRNEQLKYRDLYIQNCNRVPDSENAL